MSCRRSPVHLHSIARELAVARISLRDLEAPGRVLGVGNRPSITVQAGMGTERRRFTVAHELAHVLFMRGAPATRPLIAARVRANEWLCDDIAGRALVTVDDLGALLQAEPPTLDLVREVARATQASLSVVVSGLADVDGRTRTLLGLRNVGDGWIVLRMVGRNRGLPPDLSVPPRHATPWTGCRRRTHRSRSSPRSARTRTT